MKSLALDVPRFVFFADDAPYKDDGQVAAMFRQLDETIRIAVDAQVRTIGILLPYEYQLRSGDPEYRYPQSILEKHLAGQGVITFDLYASFSKDMRTSKTNSSDYYLFGDPMHLSALGHARVRSFLSERLHQFIETATPR
jgi:lysophospholipase L1-like esterase